MNKEEETKVAKKTGMESFEWDNSESVEFFGQKGEETPVPALTEEEKAQALLDVEEPEYKKDPTPSEKKKKEDPKKKDEPEEEIDFFKQEDETSSAEKLEGDDDFFKVIANDFKEKGILNFEEDVPEDLDEEGFTTLYENEIESRIQDTFEGFFEELDEDGKAFLKFVKDGGNSKDFLSVLEKTSAIPTGDIEDDSFQKKVAEYYFKNIEKVDDEDIADKIEWLEENDKLEKYAKKYQKNLENIEKKEKSDLAKRQQDAADTAAKDTAKFQKELKSELDKFEAVKNLPLLKNEKAELLNFITKPSVKIGKNNYITEFQASLQKISGEYEGLIALAKLMKSDFDFSSIATKETTKQTKALKGKIQRAKSNLKPNSSGSSMGKQLSDFF